MCGSYNIPLYLKTHTQHSIAIDIPAFVVTLWEHGRNGVNALIFGRVG